jgi:hypothetical protein
MIERRYVLGWNFGWGRLMEEARRISRDTGRRQRVLRDGRTWLIVNTERPRRR